MHAKAIQVHFENFFGSRQQAGIAAATVREDSDGSDGDGADFGDMHGR